MACAYVPEDDFFLLETERVREKITVEFRRAHEVLQKREADLFRELLQIEAKYRGEEVTEQIQKISSSKGKLKKTMERNSNKKVLEQDLAALDARMAELEVELATGKNKLGSVAFEWDPHLEKILSVVGEIKVKEPLDFNRKGKPVLVACRHHNEQTETDGMFCCPQSIGIDPQTRNIYITDEGNNRVQVFTQSLDFIFKFDERMSSPGGICISHDAVFVTQHKGNSLNVYSVQGEFLRSVGSKGDRELEFDMPTGVTVSAQNNRIYICELTTRRVQCLYSNLRFHSFIRDILIPKDVKCTYDEIIILNVNSPCITMYNYSHQFVREIISCGEGGPVILPFNFCLDHQGNFLIIDFVANSLVIFSNRGRLLHIIGQEGEGLGEFISPTAIAIDAEDRIIVASENPEHCIQLF